MKAADTNVHIYALDATDILKHQRALDLLKQWSQPEDKPIHLWQVACEYLSYLHRQQRQKRFMATQVSELFRKLTENCVLTLPDSDVPRIAIELFNRHSLSHWDSLLVAACLSAGVDTLYSEDMSHGATYDSVTVINPFLAT